MDIEELGSICMEMISNAGEGRFYTHEALGKTLEEKFIEASELLIKAEEFLGEAHKIQFEQLMTPQMRGENLPFSMLLLHAMDLLMVSTSEHDMLSMIVNRQLEKERS
ncbi:MAG: PTS lactose/cellobiose transporter subunit IIA [Chloroflexi bacterium]|nr:PTS lactose/cellobiose transporter subunit IIA [Chloroflexota bacterium]